MRTKALSISREVKKAVAERDSCDGYPCCIWCGKPAPTEPGRPAIPGSPARPVLMRSHCATLKIAILPQVMMLFI